MSPTLFDIAVAWAAGSTILFVYALYCWHQTLQEWDRTIDLWRGTIARGLLDELVDELLPIALGKLHDDDHDDINARPVDLQDFK